MALIRNPEKLLRVIWNGNYNTVFVYEDGSWHVDRKTKQELITLNRSEISEPSKLEALNQLMILNTKLLEATTVEYAEKAKKEYENSYELWKESQQMAKELYEVKGEIYRETPFEYSPYPTVEERFEEHYGQLFLHYFCDITKQLSIEHNANFDFSIYVEGDESYGFGSAENYNLDIPFNSKIAFFTIDDKHRPIHFIGENHTQFLKIKNEVSRITKLALNDAHNSVKEDIHEWFREQFGRTLN